MRARCRAIGARFAHGQITLEARGGAWVPRVRVAGRRVPVPGHGGDVAGGRRGAGHVAAAFRAGALGTPDLARHGAALGARRAGDGSARHAHARHSHRRALHNAMVVHAAFGGSTNLILHLPAIAHSAGLRGPRRDDWTRINRQVPRLVDALPNGPRIIPTVQVFLAGGVPEVMLHLRRAGLLETGRAHRQRRNAGRDARLVGDSRSGARRCGACCASATASIRTTSSWIPTGPRATG